MEYAPIVCFGFDRPLHLKRMLETLEKNKEAAESNLFICIDGPKDTTDKELHSQTLKIANEKYNFKKISIIERSNNLGLRNNIVQTITEVMNKFDRVIVLEDDLIIGPNFLNYMNNALSKYRDNNQVWHINGYCYPQINNSKKSSFAHYISPWGWGTWRDKWDLFINGDYFHQNLISQLSKEDINRFNIFGHYDWENILIKTKSGSVNSWAAFWYQAIFLNDGLSLFPNKSHTQNGGFDGTGEHCSDVNDWNTSLNKNKTTTFPNKLSTSKTFLFNSKLFFKIYNFKRYLRFHKDKFTSPKNFYNFLKNKLNSIS